MKLLFIVLIKFLNSNQIDSNIVLPKCAAWNRWGETVAGDYNGIAGPNNTQLDGPYGFYLSINDNIHIADTYNNRIIRYVKKYPLRGMAQGRGVGTNDFESKKPTSIYYDGSTSYYVGDSENARIVKWNFTQPTSSVTIAGKLGQLNNTNDTFGGGFLGIHMDTNGGLYVSDSYNHRIMYFAPNQTEGIQIIGTGQPGSASNELNEPMFFYLDPNGTLFIADHKNRRIQKWEQNATEGVTIADSSPPLSLKDPRSLTMDSDGNMYIVDNELSQIIKWNFILKEVSCVLGCSGITGNQADQLNRPNFIQFDSYRNLLVSDTGNNRVQLFSFYIDQNCLRANKNCRPPKVIITPEHPLYINTPDINIEQDKPIEYSVSTKINCDSITYITRQWNIFSCLNLGGACVSNNYLNNLMATLLSQNTSDIYIPPLSLELGYYRIECNVTIFPYGLHSLATSFIKIIPSRMQIYFVANRLIQITIHRNELLKFEPVKYSIDHNKNGFELLMNDVTYQCRFYPNSSYLSDSNNQAVKIGYEQTVDSTYSPCLTSNDFYYNNNRSVFSLTVYPNTLLPGQIYEFQMILLNKNFGKILVNVIDSPWSFGIGIKCALNTYSVVDEYYEINADTDTIFHSFCLNNCSLQDFFIQWEILGGKQFFSNNSIDWSLYEFNEQEKEFHHQNLTIKKDWFRTYPYVKYLLLKVFYRSSSVNGYGISYIKIRYPLMNEICSISPLNGSTETLFHIECNSSFYTEQKRYYTLFVVPSNISLSTFISSKFDAYLPIGDPKNNFQLDLIVEIRDECQSSQQFVLQPIIVTPDIEVAMDLIANSSISIQGNRSEVSQHFISIASILNYISLKEIQQLLNTDPTINISSFFISSLDENRLISSPDNQSVCFDQYLFNLNHRSNLREKLISSYIHYYPQTIHSLVLVSSTLNQLTFSPNELLHSSLLNVSTKCHQMSQVLHFISPDIIKEQIEQIVNQLTQCVTNILTGINSVLLKRAIVLEEDIYQINQQKDEDYHDLYTEKDKHFYYQKQLTNIIEKESIETMNLLNEVLDIHLNSNEQIEIQNSKYYFRLSKRMNLILNNQSMYFSHRILITPLPQYGLNDHYIKDSYSFSISIYDQYRNELKISDSKNYLIELIIPRDINMIYLEFREENLLDKNISMNYNYHYIPLIQTDSNFNYSFHFEFQSFNRNLSYLLIYKFNSFPKLNSINGHIYFCFNNHVDYHNLFINNLSTINEKFIVIGIRELNSNELCQSNKSSIPINLKPIIFSSNYAYRYYSSACFYRDEAKHWRTDGLIIGPKTNLTHTHCYLHHL